MVQLGHYHIGATDGKNENGSEQGWLDQYPL